MSRLLPDEQKQQCDFCSKLKEYYVSNPSLLSDFIKGDET